MTLEVTDMRSGTLMKFKNVERLSLELGGLVFVEYENGEQTILSPYAFAQITIKEQE